MSSLGQLRNPYANMSNFLGQWGQERDKQKQIDLQNQRQAVLDGYAKDQNQRQQEASQRQATQAEHQNTLFGEKQDVFKQNQNRKDYNKAFNSASTYYRQNPNNPAYKEAYLNTKALADPEVVQAEQNSWNNSLKTKSLLKTQDYTRANQKLARRNANAQYTILQDKLNTINQTKQYNAAFNNAGKEMQEKSKQLGNYMNDHTILNSLSPEDHDLFNRGTATPDAYNSLNTTDKVKFDNLQKAIASNSVNLYDTIKKRQSELDPTSPNDRVNYMEESGKLKDNDVFNKNLVDKTNAYEIARSNQLSKFNKQLQELTLKTDPGDAKRISTYATQVKDYKANINKNADYAHKWLAKAKKDDGSYNRKISDYANQGYDGTQITMFLSGQRPGAPRNTPPVKSLDLTGAEKTQAQIDNIKSKIALLNEKHTPIGSIDVNKIAKDSFGNINVNATPEQINYAKQQDISIQKQKNQLDVLKKQLKKVTGNNANNMQGSVQDKIKKITVELNKKIMDSKTPIGNTPYKYFTPKNTNSKTNNDVKNDAQVLKDISKKLHSSKYIPEEEMQKLLKTRDRLNLKSRLQHIVNPANDGGIDSLNMNFGKIIANVGSAVAKTVVGSAEITRQGFLDLAKPVALAIKNKINNSNSSLSSINELKKVTDNFTPQEMAIFNNRLKAIQDKYPFYTNYKARKMALDSLNQ